jgi:Fe-S-cluster containining protein
MLLPGELTLDARLHLTCTRLGTCCHGHQIFICPWELARLAAGMGHTPAAFRARFTDCGGSRLIFNGPLLADGPDSHRGKAACALYDQASGCTAHAHRPLVCRLYPLGRKRREGTTIYHHTGERLPCFTLCPTITDFPQQTVGEYIAGQDVAGPEAAHDAYAALAYGMVNAAVVIARHVPHADAGALPAFFAELRALSASERPQRIPAAWLDLLTIPSLSVPLDDPAAFVTAHGQALAAALQTTFASSTAPDALTQAARLYLTLALHLGATVGTDSAVMAQLLTPEHAPG